MVVINQVTQPNFNSKGYYLPFALLLRTQKQLKKGEDKIKYSDYKHAIWGVTHDDTLISESVKQLCDDGYIYESEEGLYTIDSNILSVNAREVYLNGIFQDNIYNDIILLTVIKNKAASIDDVANRYEDKYGKMEIEFAFSYIADRLHHLFELGHGYGKYLSIKQNKIQRTLEYLESGGYVVKETQEYGETSLPHIHYGDVVYGDKAGGNMDKSFKNEGKIKDSQVLSSNASNNDSSKKITNTNNPKGRSSYLKRVLLWVTNNIGKIILAIIIAFLLKYFSLK